MPNNCSTLIQRKQNILHKILRSNSDGKLQNAVAETTAELCVAGTRKTPAYSPIARRSHLFSANHIQPSSNQLYDTYLPSIRDAHGIIDQQNPIHDEYYSRSKTLSINTSQKSIGRPPSTSISSIFNALAKQSSENFASTYGNYGDTTNQSPVPPSRRSQRLHKGSGIKHTTTTTPQKQSGDSGIDIRFSSSSNDTNQQQRVLGMSNRLRTNTPQVHIESPLVQETATKERTHLGQHYQRRQNNSVKAPTKQKIDKYRRRSEEVTQAMNGHTPTNNGLTTAVPTLAPSPSPRPKPPPPPSPTAALRRVSSDGGTQARLEVLRVSMDTNLIQTNQQLQSKSHQYSRYRVKSPYLYTNHQPIKPTTPISNPPTPSARLRRIHGPTQPTSSVISSHHHPPNNQQQQNSMKQSTNTSPGNLYLAFIASRHLSSLEDALFEYDIDHQKLLRIFTWLKGVEDHRHAQLDPDQLLIEQNQHLLDQEEDLSLYSEIQNAVDDLPANTTGKPCEKIATMQFED